MGSSGKHRPKSIFRFRKILIASGVTLAVATSATWAYAATGGSAPDQINAELIQNRPPSPTVTGDGQASKPMRTTRSTKAAKATKPKAKRPMKPRKTKRVSAYKVVGGGRCEASYYGEGRMTASGESFDPSELTAAHRTLSFGTRVRVINANNGGSAIVRINDRGPYVSGRCLDLSTAAMKAIGGLGSGVIPVKYLVLAKN